MEATLPLPAEALPQNLRRFGDPNAPAPAKMMAAKGLVPVKGADLVTLLCQLAADADENVAEAAGKSLDELPENVLLPACAAELPGPVAAAVAERFRDRDEVLDPLVQNASLPDAALARVARMCSERISEIIAVNQTRLLAAPEIVEALYKNKNTRMSTADRLIELCARNGVRLEGIPSFDAHVEAIQGQLIPEPTEEPLPTDTAFAEVLVEESDEDAIEIDKVDGKEELKEKYKPLSFRIREMTTGEKIRLALVGDAAARSILVRDPNKQVSHAAISSPSMGDAEAAAIAHSKEVSDAILRYIGTRKEWVRHYDVKRALAFNPKTPLGVSLKFLGHLRANDLKTLSRSRGIPNPLKTAARQRLQKKSRG
ncbi:MAG TPA: hypothetical protein RMH85_30505 [Polyangiaceae bacterium LLY-WYZ-15_(1-7)]|nr:hypothetical protein [Myxococcales bacterium]MBJ72136.1 hypothetical protein [Sandaracinus sp.]HJK90324.1 hypothetical protein [Polyangiaceae bacterium LLY-WYZ-15_(1-7)]HJL05410.1 hypothetical protein [Polyangiaceae bacterium LLY-WYZ-15_(1-7)]HJL12854.1 hypothetical protein [Polyangiaceae bacterium LLY-WYZ-15_(1-7)]